MLIKNLLLLLLLLLSIIMIIKIQPKLSTWQKISEDKLLN